MPEKRPYAHDGLEYGDSKRSRSNNGSPAPAANKVTNGAGSDETDQKKADVAARLAALKAKVAGQMQNKAPAPTAETSTSSAVEDAKARIAAMRARMNGGTAPAASPSPVPQAASTTAQNGGSDPAARQAQAQAQLAALKAIAAERQRQTAPPPPPSRDNTRIRGGLGIGLHPALMGDLTKQGAKDATKDQNEKRKTSRANPYLEPESAGDDAAIDPAAFDSRIGKARVDRKSRAMIFNQKGKFILQAENLRAQEKLEKMKQDMQAQARKRQIEEATERSYLVQAPPDIEWWDESLVNGPSYDVIDAPEGLKFDIITEYVQHPVLLEPPQEKFTPAPKPMYLTKKEQAKLRRQRRMEDHKEEQAKIRLGLIPPPPPKVKKSNLMRVLGQEAVNDPTAVEARVNREIAERANKHEENNEDRKLTKEQQHEKLARQQEGDAAKGLRVAVFRVENLSYGKHRYLIDVNAKEHKLTGIVIFHPKMNLVVVEGGAHGINKYKKLMLNRIRWIENAAPLGDAREKEHEEKEWLQSLDGDGRLKDLSYNRCTLVWEGEEGSRAFKYWGSKECETDGEAKDALARMKMENMWTLAQSMQIES